MSAQGTESVRKVVWKQKEGWQAALFLAPAIIFLLTYIAYPIISTFRYSLYSWSGLSSKRTFIGLENFWEFFSDPIIWKSLSHNLIFLIFGLAIILPVSFILALILSKGGIKLSPLFKAVYFFPVVLNLVVIGTVWRFFYNPSKGLLNQILNTIGLNNLTHAWLGEQQTAIWALLFVSLWMRTGYYIVVYMSGIESIHTDIWDAMKIDGAGLLRGAVSVVVPIMKPVIASTMTMALIYSINDFGMIWVMTEGGPIRSTEILGTYMFKEAFKKFHMGYGSAIVVAMLVISITVSILQMRLLERDIVQY
jgi:ABC-type sugar transport system permease subunit